MVQLVLFYSSIAAPVPSPLLCSTCLTLLFNMFCWAINQELCFMSILKKFAKLKRKKTVVEFFLEKLLAHISRFAEAESHDNFFIGIIEVIICSISRIAITQSLQIFDKFCRVIWLFFWTWLTYSRDLKADRFPSKEKLFGQPALSINATCIIFP